MSDPRAAPVEPGPSAELADVTLDVLKVSRPELVAAAVAEVAPAIAATARQAGYAAGLADGAQIERARTVALVCFARRGWSWARVARDLLRRRTP